jgi:hypothetical protein
MDLMGCRITPYPLVLDTSVTAKTKTRLDYATLLKSIDH